jgi:hypothetical protein
LYEAGIIRVVLQVKDAQPLAHGQFMTQLGSAGKAQARFSVFSIQCSVMQYWRPAVARSLNRSL